MLIATLRFRDAAVPFRSRVLTVRCFAALALPESAREALARAIAPFRDRNWPVRWVPVEGAHVTLKFYGEVNEDRVDAIAESLDYAAEGIGVLPLALTGFGALPRPERARVFFAAVEAPPALELMQDRIETRAEALDHPGEGTVFHPHVTIGRVREGMRVPQAEAGELFAAPLHAGFTVDRVVLYRSTLGPGGAQYSPLHEARLTK
ncbi:MAG TPA: RNA 2',3'-cyclic phosphodiesterase [Gemmatimonadales bacterium]|nr:RNA 2',3'-cyclic phosphodiesterase [Gemmatimonadales bacterium]